MSTNQTIDGVRRELLERLLVATATDSTPANPAWYVEELRALLDATDAGISASPAAPKPTGLSQGWNLTRKQDGFVVGHQSVAYPPDEKAIERAERGGYVWVPFLVPAAQPQGEPVAMTNAQRRAADYKEQQAFNDWAWNKEGEAIGRMDGQAAAIEAWHARAKLAEQPAPVAVDETAEFSKWTHEVIAESRIGGVTLKVQRVQHLTPSEEKSAHDAWMARAAMNAKSR